MTEDLVQCSCCGKMVSRENIELTFKKPDDLVSLTEEELESRCKFNSGIFILDEEYYYIRAVLPLPVKETQENYNLGVWVQLPEKEFEVVWRLWDDENQHLNPPLQGILANSIPLTSASKNSFILLHLKGTKSRPEVEVLNENCSLFSEQKNGISLHRAGEFSARCK